MTTLIEYVQLLWGKLQRASAQCHIVPRRNATGGSLGLAQTNTLPATRQAARPWLPPLRHNSVTRLAKTKRRASPQCHLVSRRNATGGSLGLAQTNTVPVTRQAARPWLPPLRHNSVARLAKTKRRASPQCHLVSRRNATGGSLGLAQTDTIPATRQAARPWLPPLRHNSVAPFAKTKRPWASARGTATVPVAQGPPAPPDPRPKGAACASPCPI